MSQELKNIATATGSQPNDPPVADPPLTPGEQAAARVLAAVTSAKGEISPLDSPVPATKAYVRANSSMDVEFISGVVSVVENNPQLKGLAVTIDLAEAKATIAYLRAFEPVVIELEAFLKNLKFSIATRKAVTGAQALRTYQVLKGFARDQRFALSSHTAILKQKLAAKRSRTSAQAPTPTPETASGKEVAKS